MTTWFDRAPEPVPYEQRLSFWHRTKARLEERRRERQEQEARENMDISKWLAEKAPTRTELIAQDTLDRIIGYLPEDRMPNPHTRHVHIGTDGVAIFEGELDLTRSLHPAPISSARRTRQVERLETIDVDEVFWDIASMIDAHRNGATALDRPDYVEEVADDPVWQELTTRKWDPTHEMGPRERDWLRKQAKR